MNITQYKLSMNTEGKGLYPITAKVQKAVGTLPEKGLMQVFIQHTSASLLIQENADPTARLDLQEFFERLAPEGESWHKHTLEGPDDTTSHLKSALTQTSLNLPIENHAMALGTWQGLYLFEHREGHQQRRLLITVLG